MIIKLKQVSAVVYIVLSLLCLSPFITAPLALFLGLVFALIFENPYPKFNKKSS